MNTFGYVGGKPISHTDFYGLVEGSESNKQKRKDMAKKALEKNGSNKYAKKAKHSKQYPENSWKCSAFVCDVAKEAGASTLVKVPSGEGEVERCATAAEHAVGDVPEWRKLEDHEAPEPGDIAASKNIQETSTGHASVVVPDGNGGVSTIGAHENRVGPLGGDVSDNTVYKRFTGD